MIARVLVIDIDDNFGHVFIKYIAINGPATLAITLKKPDNKPIIIDNDDDDDDDDNNINDDKLR